MRIQVRDVMHQQTATALPSDIPPARRVQAGASDRRARMRALLDGGFRRDIGLNGRLIQSDWREDSVSFYSYATTIFFVPSATVCCGLGNRAVRR